MNSSWLEFFGNGLTVPIFPFLIFCFDGQAAHIKTAQNHINARLAGPDLT
jgi:hypothetical protein